MKTSSPETMKIRIVFANRVTSPDEAECVLAWDENQIESSPKAYDEDRDKMLREVMGTDLLRYVELDVEVPMAQVHALLNGRIEMQAVSIEPVAH